jgi:hypothetical protein
MLKSIWEARADSPAIVGEPNSNTLPVTGAEKLAPRSLVIPPQLQKVRLSDLVEARRAFAA